MKKLIFGCIVGFIIRVLVKKTNCGNKILLWKIL